MGGLSNGGALTSVDRDQHLATDFDKYQAAVASVIPPQKAGHAADLAGVADRTGWCPVDPLTFDSKLQSDIHVIGDAAIAGAMPRSASAAHSQGMICAAAIVALFAGGSLTQPTLISPCYSLIAPDYAISQRGTYRPSTANTPKPTARHRRQPAGCPSRRAKRRSRTGRRLVQHHHRRGVRMKRRV